MPIPAATRREFTPAHYGGIPSSILTQRNSLSEWRSVALPLADGYFTCIFSTIA